MGEWKTYKLSDISSFKTGKLDSNASCEGGKYPFFTCSPETLRINNYAFDQKAIILAGNNAEGNFSVKYYHGKFNAYQRTYVFTANESIVNPIYLYYALRLCLLDFKQMSQGTSTKFLTAKILNSFEVRIPTIPVQNRIVGILRSLEEKLEINDCINHNLLNIAQDLFDKEIAGIAYTPNTCRVASLLDIADFLNGLAMQKFHANDGEIGLPVLKIKELGQQECDASSDRCSESIPEQYIVKDGDIIFSWSGTLLVDFWCGGCCGLNQHLFKVSSNNYPDWFIYFWTKHHLDRFIRIAKDKAVTMGHIKRGDLGKAEVIIPKDAIMKTVDIVIAPLISEYVERRTENRRLRMLRDSLLPELMSGQLTY